MGMDYMNNKMDKSWNKIFSPFSSRYLTVFSNIRDKLDSVSENNRIWHKADYEVDCINVIIYIAWRYA